MLFNFTIEGNLANAPRLTRSKNGHPMCVVRVLHNTRYRNAQGQWIDGRTVSVDLVCWRDLAERVAGLNKGDTIIAEIGDDLNIDTRGQYPSLSATARSVAVSLRWHGATSHRGAPTGPQDPWATEIEATGGHPTGATDPEPSREHDAYQPATA